MFGSTVTAERVIGETLVRATDEGASADVGRSVQDALQVDGPKRSYEDLRHDPLAACVDAVPRGVALPKWRPTRLNERYATALSLAELICSNASFTHRTGAQRATGFLVDMAKVFEDFVSIALGAALERIGGRCRSQWTEYLDSDANVRMELDLVWHSGDRHALAVIDAKYKAEKQSGFPNADVYQLLAYCTALQLGNGHLVYAKGNESARSHDVRHVGIRIHIHTLDLSLRPAELLEAVERLAGQIGSSVVLPAGVSS